jgi:uncharacterized caspase-like protein
VILDAGGDNEVSKEDEALGRGVFTTTSLKGLQGLADSDEDGLITVDEAYGYVFRRVPKATGQEQHTVRKEGEGTVGLWRKAVIAGSRDATAERGRAGRRILDPGTHSRRAPQAPRSNHFTSPSSSPTNAATAWR